MTVAEYGCLTVGGTCDTTLVSRMGSGFVKSGKCFTFSADGIKLAFDFPGEKVRHREAVRAGDVDGLVTFVGVETFRIRLFLLFGAALLPAASKGRFPEITSREDQGWTTASHP